MMQTLISVVVAETCKVIDIAFVGNLKSTRLDIVPDETLAQLYRSGLELTYLGVLNVNPTCITH